MLATINIGIGKKNVLDFNISAYNHIIHKISKEKYNLSLNTNS